MSELDLGPQFSPESEYLHHVVNTRDRLVEGRIPLGLPYFDDALGGLYPRDLLVLGADTGIGKTTLALDVALAGAKADKQVFMFALEAEPGELAARLYYEELARRVKDKNLDFAAWWRRQRPDLDEEWEPEVIEALKPTLDNLHTLYRKRGQFSTLNLYQQIEAIVSEADMIILDHLLMVEDHSDKASKRAEVKTIELLADAAFHHDVGILCVSHVRKEQAAGFRGPIPKVDDLYGGRQIGGLATGIMMIAREWDGPRPEKHLFPTLLQLPKDRRGRGSSDVARVYYDVSRGRYEQAYELGKLHVDKQRKRTWVPLEEKILPPWAKHEARKIERCPF